VTRYTGTAKQAVRIVAAALVCANTALFLVLAWYHQLSSQGKGLVFVDFWGRFTIYSFWIIGYALFRKYLLRTTTLKYLVLLLVCANIPLFLLLAYFDKISNDPQNLVFVDFWGRLTVYSLWFMVYEGYRKYMDDPAAPGARLPAD
jgi:uncharacterized protein (DUF486 family)